MSGRQQRIGISQHNTSDKTSSLAESGSSTCMLQTCRRYVASDTPHNPRWNASRLLLFHLPTDVPLCCCNPVDYKVSTDYPGTEPL